jgi:hypothetical protein
MVTLGASKFAVHHIWQLLSLVLQYDASIRISKCCVLYAYVVAYACACSENNTSIRISKWCVLYAYVVAYACACCSENNTSIRISKWCVLYAYVVAYACACFAL